MGTRTIRTATAGALALLALLAVAALAPAGASAATTCRQYDEFQNESVTKRNVRVCAAPAADFPRHTGWARIVNVYDVRTDPCGFNLLPYDIDDPVPAIGCPMVLPAPVPSWSWTGTTWRSHPGSGPVGDDAAAFRPGSAVYVAPYANGWRWAWTKQTGWRAVREGNVAFRWFAS